MRLVVPGAIPAIDSGTPLVTSSRALRDVAYQQFARSQMEAGAQSWQRPDISTYDAWLTSIWQDARYEDNDLPILLAPAQEHLLWEQIIREARSDVFEPASLARLAASAADTVVEFSLPLQHDSWNEQQDAEQFQTWFQTFRERCREAHWMSRREILVRIKPRSRPAFVGFDRLPAPGTLLEADNGGKPGRVPFAQCDSEAEELELAARWARARFEENERGSVAVFVPGLRSRVHTVHRIFHSVFYPARAAQFGPESSESVFHVNAPQPLGDHPLIASAVLLLELARPRMGQSDAAAIIRCPFVAGAIEERGLRANADLNLRRSRELEVSFDDIKRATRDCPRASQAWKRVTAVLERRRADNEFPRWARFFADLLQATGWPGDADLTPEEQHVVEMWKDGLSSLSGLGMVSSSVSFETAHRQLKRLLAIGGMERGDWLSPVQILHAEDAIGIEFDAAFLTGLDDETWPDMEPISPLIPARLQRSAGVPGADPHSVHRAGLKATRALVQAGISVAGSYRERLAPQVYATVGRVVKFAAATWTGARPVETIRAETLAEYTETSGHPFELGNEARGGTRLIKAQSECPFKAYAAHRLKAISPEDGSFGFNALERGSFVHRALEHVWKQLRSQSALLAMNAADLQDLVQGCVRTALAEAATTEFYKEAREVEQERLEALVLDWLETVEKNRAVPFTVEIAEQRLPISLAGLSLTVQMDRVDRLPNGSIVLIDYKTGDVTKNSLIGERPAEPQLLVYAAALAERVEGVLFGCVDRQKPRLAGFVADRRMKSRTVDVPKSWDGFLGGSLDSVEKLVAEFKEGKAVIRPSHKACSFCDFPALCRKNEQALWTEEE